jgi:FAD:protein FMN transferase
MKQTEVIMGMPITIEVAGETEPDILHRTFTYFREVDERYSPYKSTSEVCRANAGQSIRELSSEFQWVLDLCAQTKTETMGYFDAFHGNKLDPSGLVKGWAIQNAANQLRLRGHTNFYIEAGGDVQIDGLNENGQSWSLGIRNPFDTQTIVKQLAVSGCGVATSGTYIRGDHIYDPVHDYAAPRVVQSITIIGPNVYDADRFATAAFAMGSDGVNFIENLKGFEAYMIDNAQTATFTSGFSRYVA